MEFSDGLQRLRRSTTRWSFRLEHHGSLTMTERSDLRERLLSFEDEPYFWLPVSEEGSVLRVDHVEKVSARRMQAIGAFADALKELDKGVRGWAQFVGNSARELGPSDSLVTVAGGWPQDRTRGILELLTDQSSTVSVSDKPIVASPLPIGEGWKRSVVTSMAASLTGPLSEWAFHMGDGPIEWVHLTGHPTLAVVHRRDDRDDWADSGELLSGLAEFEPSVAFATYVANSRQFVGHAARYTGAGLRPALPWTAALVTQARVGHQSDVHPIQLVTMSAVGTIDDSRDDVNLFPARSGRSLVVVGDREYWTEDLDTASVRRLDLLREWWPEVEPPDGVRWYQHMTG